LSDSERNARLLGGPLKTRAVPPYPVRVAQRVAMKANLLGYENGVLKPLLAARHAPGPPRFLVRVDEFPHYLAGDEPDRYGVESSRAFHHALASAGVSYLMAIVPRVPSRPLDPDASGDRPLTDAERDFLGEMERDGVTFALHGYNHRTRYANPRRHSELSGLSTDQLRDLLERALEELAPSGVRPRVFVPPFNRFDAGQYDLLASQFDVVCGGPESVPLMGFHPGPQWRGDAVYLPCYPPLYGTAEECLPVIADLVRRQVGVWVPIVLHPGWEAGPSSGLERFAGEVAPFAADWGHFLAAVDASR
jgi:peptidoglycan/xylan/chitin deacetylase (PgdA/CDA1 family)